VALGEERLVQGDASPGREATALVSADGRPNRRILWLIKGLDPGGAELLLTLAARVRDRERFRYEVAYILPWRRALVGELEASGVRVHSLNGGADWDLGWTVRLRRLLRSGRYDVLHAHSPYAAGLARLVVRSLPAAERPRLVSTEHTPWWGYVLPTRLLNALTYLLDDEHLVVSRAVYDSIPRWMRGGVRIVPLGIHPERLSQEGRSREDVRRELGVQDGEVLVGTVANLRPEKRYSVLLRAARHLIDTGLPVRFAAVGEGPIRAEIEAEHRALGLGDRFRLLGYRKRPATIVAACDVFVLASAFEGLSLALLEALALGVPVVATDVGGIPECVTHGVEGLLVPPDRADLLARALRALVVDPERRAAMGRAAMKRAEGFDITKATRDIEDLYEQLIRRGAVSPGSGRELQRGPA
jgi:glycosyltransferase involved in cell wall biosynthesis